MRNGDYSVSPASVEAELAFCQSNGYIAAWVKNDGYPGTRQAPRYSVWPIDGGRLDLKDVQEAHIFVRGVYSHLAFDVHRRKAEAQALAEYETAKAQRLAEEREREELAVQTTECPSCGQPAGERCLREPVDPTPYAAQPHRPRVDKAGVLIKHAVLTIA